MPINFKLSDGEKQQIKRYFFLIHLICDFEKHVSKLEAYF